MYGVTTGSYTSILGKELGDLGSPEKVRCFINLSMLLGNLIFRYAASLASLSQTLGGKRSDSCAPKKVDLALIARFRAAMLGCFALVDPTPPPAS